MRVRPRRGERPVRRRAPRRVEPAQAEHARDRPQLAAVQIAGRRGALERAQPARARGEIDRPAVVGIDQRAVAQLAALVEIRNAGRDQLDQEQGERVAIGKRSSPAQISIRAPARHTRRVPEVSARP